MTSKFRMTARLSGTDLGDRVFDVTSSLTGIRPMLCSNVPVISRFLKYKLCPPPFLVGYCYLGSKSILTCTSLVIGLNVCTDKFWFGLGG